MFLDRVGTNGKVWGLDDATAVIAEAAAERGAEKAYSRRKVVPKPGFDLRFFPFLQ